MTSTKQFVWCYDQMCEARTSSGTVNAQYFPRGETISGTNYYYTLDHLGSVRELTDSAGTIQAQYSFDPFGIVAKISQAVACDFGFAGMYLHSRSSLNSTLFRPYSPGLGRFINRDPFEESGGINLFTYAVNNPANFVDPLGLCCSCPSSGRLAAYRGCIKACSCFTCDPPPLRRNWDRCMTKCLNNYYGLPVPPDWRNGSREGVDPVPVVPIG